MMVFGCYYLDDIAGFQVVFEGYHAAVNFGPGALVADFGMNQIGEINRCGAPGQRFDLTVGREDINFVREQINAYVFKKLVRIPYFRLVLNQVLEPGKGVACFLIGLLAFFVTPVSGNA